MDKVIPLCLSLIDDYKMESKLVGVTCLSHITSNVNRTELKWFKEILIKTMFDSLVFREYPFLSLLVPCLLETLFLVEPAPMSSSYVNSQTVVLVKHVPNCFRLHDSDLLSDKYGVLISYFIKECSRIVKNGSSHERKLQLIYLRAIESLVKKMGLRTVVYFKSLLPVLFEYLKITMDSFSNSSEGNLLCCVLTITETLVLYCWPRMTAAYAKEFVILLKPLKDLFVNQDGKEPTVVNSIPHPSSSSIYVEISEKLCSLLSLFSNNVLPVQDATTNVTSE